jgi:hypothetical protein
MWVEQTGLTQIDTKVRYGAAAEVDRLLQELLAGATTPATVPVGCPTCQRDLVRQSLAIGTLFVSACPNGHGAWLSPETAESLRSAVGNGATSQRWQWLGVIGIVAVMSIVLFAIWPWRSGQDMLAPRSPEPEAVAPAAPTTATAPAAAAASPDAGDRVDNATLSEQHWPDRQWPGARPIPLKESRIDVHEELLYFDQLLGVLAVGISNRLNMEGVLAVPRAPERYEALYDVYRERQENVLDRLRRLQVPERLQPTHEQIVLATEQQIVFYGDFARAKAADATTDLRRLLAHPAVREQNRALLDAWGRVRQLYPDLDTATRDAIYHHLCGFDTV